MAGLKEMTERAPDGGPLLDTANEEELRYTQPNVAIALGEARQEEIGTLHITTRRLIWFSGASQERGYAVDFPSLILHAISRNPEAYPRPCIYTQIDSGLEKEDDDDEELEGQPESGVQDVSAVSELRLIPEDASVLDHIFAVMSECAELNPDLEDDEDGAGEFFYDEDEVRGNESRGAALDHYDSLLQEPQQMDELMANDPHRFDDADDDEELPTTH